MSPLVVTLIMVGAALVAIFAGFPIVWCMGGVATVAALVLWGPHSLEVMALGVFDSWADPILMALPLFIFMSSLLQHSGMGDDLFEMIYWWMGRIRGGLAMGTIFICTIFAAMSTSVTAAIAVMSLIALPAMSKRKYHKDLALGTILAGGSLGPTIPPSIDLIIYASIAKESVGKLWFGAIVPGFIMALGYVAYVGLRCFSNPRMGPAVPAGEAASWGKKFGLLRAVIAPIAIVALILVGIYSGMVTPTEASAVGALAMLVIVAVRRRLTFEALSSSLWLTLRVTAMLFWLLIGVHAFNSIYIGLGARSLVEDMVLGLEASPFMIVVVMMLIILVFGTMMDDWAIMLICASIFVPIIKALGLNTVWFGILFLLAILLGCCTPPYGYNLFVMKALAPKGITMGDIYRSILPFVAVQICAIVLFMFFPAIITWLPSMVFAK